MSSHESGFTDKAKADPAKLQPYAELRKTQRELAAKQRRLRYLIESGRRDQAKNEGLL